MLVSTESVPIADDLTKPADVRLSRRRMLADCAVIAVVEAFKKYEVVEAIMPFLNHSGVVVD